MNNSKRSVVAAFASFILAMFVVSPIAIAICFPPSSYAHEENKIKHFVSTYEIPPNRHAKSIKIPTMLQSLSNGVPARIPMI